MLEQQTVLQQVTEAKPGEKRGVNEEKNILWDTLSKFCNPLHFPTNNVSVPRAVPCAG